MTLATCYLIRLVCVYNPGAIWFFFLSSPPPGVPAAASRDAVVLPLLFKVPVVVTGSEQDGDQACFYF